MPIMRTARRRRNSGPVLLLPPSSSIAFSSQPRSSFRFSTSAPRPADFTHAVIGGGVVGLAIARKLATTAASPSTSTILLERHTAVGTETSSRNSEVIHAGLYYGAGTLKTELCVRGKRQLYHYCARRGIPHRCTGKWLVAQTPAQRAALERLRALCARELGTEAAPLRWLTAAEARRREPAVRADAGVLESPSTGILDSHALMVSLLADFEHAGGTLALGAAVQAVRPAGAAGPEVHRRPGAHGWEVEVRDAASGEVETLEVETIVNSAGLGAVHVHNMIVPPERRRKMFYAKGNYFSYGASSPKVNTLVYPAPEAGDGGLGTHLTLDMGGRVKFGPDVEWVENPDDLAVNVDRLAQTIQEVKKYLPGIDATQLQADYAGIRPKLERHGAVGQGNGFVDFVIQTEPGVRRLLYP
ncbi:hypothetical protein P8C59_004282 [Phyllachora maydis]|uniref:L-2-hydroxyglutarate dehydrogenase, mitochondrial n=1 Tax=Phyllachora maydis TaxID=1825666 RepID=A0AAD9I1Y2_9PEZI|nr:hypothetical protein P8C59_004282 [Phyllachora maydis]